MTLLEPKPGRLSGALRTAGAAAIAAAVLTPAVFLRVTPAFADEPVVARRILVTAPAAPGAAAPTAATAARPARKPGVAAVRRVVSRDSEAPLPPLAPPPPPPPPAFPAAPPAPPAPPTPLVSSLTGLDIHEHIHHGRYEVVVRRALERALSAETVKETDEMRRALAELRTRQLAMVRADEAKIRADVAAAVAEFDHVRVERALDQFRSRLQSPEFRGALAAAEHQAAKAEAETKAGAGED